MRRAGSTKEVLHLWLHPHNLGADVPRGIQRIEQVLDVIERRVPSIIYASMRDLVGGGGDWVQANRSREDAVALIPQPNS